MLALGSHAAVNLPAIVAVAVAVRPTAVRVRTTE
jgi:2-methylcitrate dehydratase PrpD